MARGRPGPSSARPPGRRPGGRGGPRGGPPERGRALRAWAILGGAGLGFLLLLRVATGFLRGDGAGSSPVPTAPTGPTGPSAAPYASPPPPGSVAATFPRAASGTRLVVKVVARGRDPAVCTAESLRTAGEVRTVYHHECVAEEDFDRAFFLVRVTNLTDLLVPVSVDRFVVVDVGEEVHPALEVPPVGVPASIFFPRSLTLGPHAEITRWVTIDASDGDHPDRLVYTDGAERFIVRFRGTWL